MGFEHWFHKPTGLVLNGGGGKGAYQIGAFKALREAGLNEMVTAIAGTSVGGLNMCLFNYDDGTVGEDIWLHISPEDFIDPELNLLDGSEGLVSRTGLLNIIDSYLDLSKIRDSKVPLYATVTEYNDSTSTESRVQYMRLNGCTDERIKQILLATSSIPVIYEPVAMDGMVYRDGGLKDNLPIKPLYDLGIRQFIVILLSDTTPVPTELFPGSEFLIIRPSKFLGDAITGTLDFTAKGAKERMDLGYLDAARAIRFYGESGSHIQEIAQIELRQYENSIKVEHAMDSANSNMDKLNDLLNKFM